MCDVNTRHAQRQMNFLCCAGGESVSDSSEACGKVSNGTWQAAIYTTYTIELGMNAATILSATDNNKGWDTLIMFWQRATPINFDMMTSFLHLLTFDLISSGNFTITFLTATNWSHAISCKFDLCVKLENLICTYECIKYIEQDNEVIFIFHTFTVVFIFRKLEFRFNGQLTTYYIDHRFRNKSNILSVVKGQKQ